MSALTLFPARIRFVNADGTLTPEALRMLELLVGRVGGTVGDLGDDVHAAPPAEHGPLADVVQAYQPQQDSADAVAQPAPAAGGQPEMIMQPPPVRADQVEGLGTIARQNAGTNFTGSLTGKTVTVTNGIITSVV
jgi:hypothetical protein